MESPSSLLASAAVTTEPTVAATDTSVAAPPDENRLMTAEETAAFLEAARANAARRRRYELVKAQSRWRFKLFVDKFGSAETWPREGKSKISAAGPDGEMTTFDGYSYLQSVASHLGCEHRKRRTKMGLTAEQFEQLRAIPWMNGYLTHLTEYNAKYGSRDKHPTAAQKFLMLKALDAKPTKEDRFTITEKELLPPGVESYSFDARRFMDAIINNWKVASGVPVKRVPIKLTEQQMKELEVKWWFNDFVVKIVKKEKKKLEATQKEDESDSSSDEDVPLRARGRAAGVVVDVDSSSSDDDDGFDFHALAEKARKRRRLGVDDYKGKTVTVPAWLFDEVAGFWFKHKAKVDREPGVPYNDDGSDSSEEDEGLPVNEGQDEETNGEPGPSE